MKQQLIDDLLAFLREPPDPSSDLWCDYRDSLIEDFQAIRESMVYKPQTSYRLERRYTALKLELEYVEGKIETVPYPTMMNIARTPHYQKMKVLIASALEAYPIEELRLYHGSRRIKDIVAWLEEEQ